jgi:hypothetical protein
MAINLGGNAIRVPTAPEDVMMNFQQSLAVLRRAGSSYASNIMQNAAIVAVMSVFGPMGAVGGLVATATLEMARAFDQEA